MAKRYYKYLQFSSSDNKYLWSPAEDSFSIAIPCNPNTIYKISHSYSEATIFRCAYIRDAVISETAGVNITAYEVFLGTTETEHTITTGEGATYLIFQANAGLMPDIIKTLKVEQLYIQIKKINKNFCKITEPKLLMNSSGVIQSSNYSTTIIDTSNINSLYINGDFSLLESSVLRACGTDEYPAIGVTGTRFNYISSSNKVLDTTNYKYVMFTWVVFGGETEALKTAIENSFQIEEGTTGSSYIKHAEKTYNFPFANQKLMAGGTIQNKIINPRRHIDLSTLQWTRQTADGNGGKYSTPDLISTLKSVETSIVPNLVAEKYIPIQASATLTNGQIAIVPGSNGNYIYCYDTAGTPTGILEYELITPDETDFTASQQAVYDEIISDGTYIPVTHYSTNAVLNPDIDMTYYRDLPAIINNLENP